MFDNGGTTLASGTDGVDIYNGRAGYRRGIGTRLTLDASVQYNRVQPDPKTVFFPVTIGLITGYLPNARGSYGGLGYNLVIGYRPSPRLSADFSATRSVSSSPTVGALFVIEDALGVDASYRVGPSITAGAGATLDRRRYKGSFTSAVEPQARNNDSIARGYVRVTYAPVRLYSIDLEVAHQNRDSNPVFYNFSSTTAQLSLRVKLGRG